METINLQLAQAEEGILYRDEDIAVSINPQELRGLHTPMLLDGFLTTLIVSGTAQIYIDDQVYNLSAGNILICHPRHILERSMTSIDIRVRSTLMSPGYLTNVLRLTNLTDLNLEVLFRHHTVVQAQPHEVDLLSAYHDLVLRQLRSPQGTYHAQSVQMLLAAMTLMLYGIVRRSDDTPLEEVGTSAELIMKRFLSMLSHVPYVSVNEYAARLHIHPKYFASVCRKVTDKSPSQIIADEIIHHAQVMLREGSRSIKQIADILGFANQSHFGTFFRRHTGMSPQEFIHTQNG